MSSSTRAYRCPACNNEVDQRASHCSNAECRRPLAFCSHCRDVTTFTLLAKATLPLGRDRYRCDRCDRPGVRCLTWVSGGYCNGLARAGRRLHPPLCALCAARAADIGRGAIGHAVAGAIGVVLSKRKR